MSATSTLATLMDTIVSTTVSLATTVLTDYWPYILVFSILAGFIGVMARFVSLGGRK